MRRCWISSRLVLIASTAATVEVQHLTAGKHRAQPVQQMPARAVLQFHLSRDDPAGAKW
jgi:hypothetical protein